MNDSAKSTSMSLRVAVIFDHLRRPDTTGYYCLRGLADLARVSHFHPSGLEQIAHDDFDLFLFVDDGLDYVHPDALRPQAFWGIDTHMNFERVCRKAAQADFVLAAQQNGASDLTARLGRPVIWLPLGCDPIVHGRHSGPPLLDVCFVGNPVGKERRRLLRLLQSEFPSNFVGRQYFEEMARVYSSSRIVFNRSIKDDVNMRVFEGLCSGTLLVTNELDENGQADLFQDGRHLVTYQYEEELLDKIRFFLSHDELRIRIGATGRQEVLRGHTYRHRMQQILETAQPGTTTVHIGLKGIPSPESDNGSTFASRSATETPRSSRAEATASRNSKSAAADPLYFEAPRPDLLALVPMQARVVLDVGCGTGRLGLELKRTQDCTVYGVELDPNAAQRARESLDQVWEGDIEELAEKGLDLPAKSVDAIVFGDILEHLRDPAKLLRNLRELLTDDGVIVASIPNVMHHTVLASLLAGNWTYEPEGILDRTHLRFFTRREIEKLFYRAGFRVAVTQCVVPTAFDYQMEPCVVGPMRISGLSLEAKRELAVYQHLMVARPQMVSQIGPGTTSIVIVTHNQLAFTRECLLSIRDRTDEPYELIVVDNGSTDGTVEYLQSLQDVHLIVNTENRGFPAAVNQGIQAASGEQVLLINNDCLVTTGWLRRLRMALYRDEKVGLVGPCSNQVSGVQQIDVGYRDLGDLDGFAWEWGKHHNNGHEETDRLVGFCLLIKRELIEQIGLLDEQFGIGNFEDDDYCRRAREAGYKAVIAWDAFVHHFGGATFRASDVDFAALMRENRRLYEKKWGSAHASAQASKPSPALSLVATSTAGLQLAECARKLSVCMIVRDSSRTLDACLTSIKPWVDEMVVVDTGSTDDTVEIARNHGAKVYEFPWCDDFSAARNESLRHATGEWLLWMDSDDTIDAKNGRRLRELADRTHPPNVLGFVLQVHCPHGSADDGEVAGVTAVDHVKLIRNHPEIRFEGRIHEQVLPAINRLSGEVEWTDIFVVHSGSDHSEDGQAKKLERDLRLLKLEEQERPYHPFTLFNLGMTYLELEEYPLARRYLERTIEVAAVHESHVPKAFSLLIEALTRLHLPHEADARCREALFRFPNDPEILFRAGVLAQLAGRFEEAKQHYAEVLQQSHSKRFRSVDLGIFGYKAKHNLARVSMELGNYEDAEQMWREILTERPRYADAWRGLIGTLLKWEKLGEAEDAIRESAFLSNMPVLRLQFEAEIDRARGQFDAAKSKLEHAIAEAPEDTRARDGLCRLLFEYGEPEEAERALRGLAEQRPNDPAVHHNLGQIYLRLDRSADAASQFEMARRLRA